MRVARPLGHLFRRMFHVKRWPLIVSRETLNAHPRRFAAGNVRHRSIRGLQESVFRADPTNRTSREAKAESRAPTHAHQNDMKPSSPSRSEALSHGGESSRRWQEGSRPRIRSPGTESTPEIREALGAGVVTTHFGYVDLTQGRTDGHGGDKLLAQSVE